MKKLFIIFAIFLAGCMDTTVDRRSTKDRYRGTNIEIVTFEGCEYVRFGCGEYSWGGHKGNCKNPIHQQKY